MRVIRSRSGHEIRLTDTDGAEKIEITDKSGANSLTIDTSTNSISITAPQGKIKLSAQEIDIEASGTATLKGATVNIN